MLHSLSILLYSSIIENWVENVPLYHPNLAAALSPFVQLSILPSTSHPIREWKRQIFQIYQN
jgi:hypothetical protein